MLVPTYNWAFFLTNHFGRQHSRELKSCTISPSPPWSQTAGWDPGQISYLPWFHHLDCLRRGSSIFLKRSGNIALPTAKTSYVQTRLWSMKAPRPLKDQGLNSLFCITCRSTYTFRYAVSFIFLYFMYTVCIWTYRVMPCSNSRKAVKHFSTSWIIDTALCTFSLSKANAVRQ